MYKHTCIQEVESIHPCESEHSRGIQRGKYIKIENEINEVKKNYSRLK